MGMYNEVYCNCPECGQTCTIQISQIVLGFGKFHLQDPSTYEELTEEEVKMLFEWSADEWFHCECGHYWKVSNGVCPTCRRPI